MRLSLVTPVLTCVPGSHARWEEAAGMAELVEIARTADRLGYHHLTCSEHVAIPAEVAKVRGATYWDPLATFGYLAAVTERVRLATYVLVLGYHHPLEIAKRYGTLDLVSGGRLILGVGVGSLREEFKLLDAPFADRGARADDALVALRASLSQEQPAYHGPHYDYGGWSGRPRSSLGSRYGSAVAPGAHSGGPRRWPTVGPRSASRWRRWPTGWPGSSGRMVSRS
jgi:probable F420-dependent oxidoreductase